MLTAVNRYGINEAGRISLARTRPRKPHIMDKKLSAVRIARRNGQAIREFIATADPFALDKVIGPPEMRDASGDKFDRVMANIDDCQHRQWRDALHLRRTSPTTTHSDAYNPE